jgi:cobalamin biosynthetic protein CobC
MLPNASPRYSCAIAPRDHGGNLDAAIRRYGEGDWIDLSTGINRVPYPLPPLPPELWQALPGARALASLKQAAARAYGSEAALAVLAGAQGAIQLLPMILPCGRAKILSPTYNEYAAAFAAAGWVVEAVSTPEALAGADVAVIVNPNNPDGRSLTRDEVLRLRDNVGLLVVDESFCEIAPALSVAGRAGEDGLLVLRSFGKFYGLAGLRLGFALGESRLIAALEDAAGPWPVCGAALHVGARALADIAWQEQTRARLHAEAPRLDGLAMGAGWHLAGGTGLFRLYTTPDAAAAQEGLAKARIWSRIFPSSRHWLRLGLPGGEAEWTRLAGALRGLA